MIKGQLFINKNIMIKTISWQLINIWQISEITLEEWVFLIQHYGKE